MSGHVSSARAHCLGWGFLHRALRRPCWRFVKAEVRRTRNGRMGGEKGGKGKGMSGWKVSRRWMLDLRRWRGSEGRGMSGGVETRFWRGTLALSSRRQLSRRIVTGIPCLCVGSETIASACNTHGNRTLSTILCPRRACASEYLVALVASRTAP